jgi:hypothetical protein
MSKTWWLMVLPVSAALGFLLGHTPWMQRTGKMVFGPHELVPYVLCWVESPYTRGVGTNGQATECITVSVQMGFRSDGVVVWRPR